MFQWQMLPERKRNATIELGFFSLLIFFAGGIDFGFNAIKPALIDSHVYEERCLSEEKIPCEEQLLAINSIFQYTTGSVNAVALFLGLGLDRWGRRKSCFVASVLWYVGLITFSFSDSKNHDYYSVGLSFSAIGGALFFFSSLQSAVSFPEIGSAIDSILTVLWDLSSLMFVILAAIFYRMNLVTIGPLLAVYATPVFLLMIGFVFWRVNDLETSIINFDNCRRFCDPTLVFLLIATAVGIQYVYFLMSTLFEQALWLSNEDTAFCLLKTFNYLLPGLAIPNWGMGSYFLKITERRVYWRFVLCGGMGVLTTFLTFLSADYQVLTYILLIGWRQLAFMSFYATLHTEFKEYNAFGFLVGLGLSIGGSLSMLNPILYKVIVINKLQSDYRWFHAINGLLYGAFCVWASIALRSKQNKDLLQRMATEQPSITEQGFVQVVTEQGSQPAPIPHIELTEHPA